MATESHVRVHPDALELAEILELAWDPMKAELARTGHPTNLDDDDKDKKDDVDDKDKKDDGDAKDDVDDKDDDDAKDDDDKGDVDWKAMARKHEREKKAARKENARIADELKKRQDADKSEQEKAVDAAREEGRKAALTESQKERRHDRLEVAVARAAGKTFADIDDALMHIERKISRGDLDPDDVFDADGKVQADELKKALKELLEEKPHLGASAKSDDVDGDSDAGKGSSGKDDADMDVADHLKAAQEARK